MPYGVLGLAALLFLPLRAGQLELGSKDAQLGVGYILILFTLCALFLLYREGCGKVTCLALLLPLALAMCLRLLVLDHQTHDYQTFLSNWAAFFRENGGFAALKKPVGNYNVPYLYILALLSYLPVPDLYLIKLVSIFFDILLAWSVLRLVRPYCRQDSPAPLVSFCLTLFLPTVILNGACWAQCDSVYAALVLFALGAVAENRPKTSVVLLAIAFSFKLQTVFLIPLWCVFWFTGRVKFRHLLLFPAGYTATILPALVLGKPLGDILGIYLGQMGEYSDFLTLNAPSAFAFLPYGKELNAALLSKLGIIAAFALVFALLGALFLKRRFVTPQILLTAAVILALGVPFLLPNMHERYFFPADILTLVWACSDRRRIPVAFLAQVSSLSCYSTYLRLKYTLPLLIGGQYFVMAFEAILMLAALIWSWFILMGQLKNAEMRRVETD